MFDTHCHIDLPPLAEDVAGVMAAAREAGVTAMHVPGVSPAQWSTIAAVRTQDPRAIGISVGIHPWWLADLDEVAIEAGLHDLAAAAERHGAEAIGECGLDGLRAKKVGPSLDRQVTVLEAHLEVARAMTLPVVLHVLGAHGRAIEVLERQAPFPAPIILHSYSGSAELVARYAKLGCHFSFAAAVTRANAKKPVAAAKAVPAALLLLESDAPDQPLAGRDASAPADVAAICAAVARIRGEDPETLAKRTDDNARRIWSRGS